MTYIRTLKRIRQNKTNYRKRTALLTSRRPFVTIKVSDQNIGVQALKPTLAGDIVVASAHSRELFKNGWKGSLNSLPACYLTGLLLGKKAIREGMESMILYTGNDPFTSKVAACLKGIIAAGIATPVSEESLPADDRISGKHIANYANILKEDQTKYNTRFSLLLKNGFQPEDYPTHFEDMKAKILGETEIKEKPELQKKEAEDGQITSDEDLKKGNPSPNKKNRDQPKTSIKSDKRSRKGVENSNSNTEKKSDK